MGILFLTGDFNMNLHSMNTTRFENSTMIINGNVLRLKNNNREVILSKNQTKLMVCLINEVNEKQSIINYIWGGKKCKSKDNNYGQLVYKTKALLAQNGFPKDFIMTIPRYGLCINSNLINSMSARHEHSINILNDHACLC